MRKPPANGHAILEKAEFIKPQFNPLPRTLDYDGLG